MQWCILREEGDAQAGETLVKNTEVKVCVACFNIFVQGGLCSARTPLSAFFE